MKERPETKTAQDAYLRIANARLGYLDGEPSEEYLAAICQQLRGWLEEAEKEFNRE